ncbi:hypothetical protein [Emticicia sp. BO119]|uniref:hypothetical protein n=1 Tax=Emticicia sp. BO119 TaxID=2757768 RepID=UPI0015F11B4C|nr:hypothetical protein [Emticicia sp. BO119]MBA4849882.1 hypothetical protein [Emticicia sp. BO119]
MKKILILLTLGFGTLSCTKESSKSENEIPDSSATISIAHVSKSDLGNTIWVNARYLETLEQTKSPLKAKIYADTVMVSFNTTADTANMVWNFHEGSAFRVKKGDRLELFNIYEEKPTPEYSGNVDESTLKLENTSFKKVNTVGFIEKKFWIGKYNSNGKTIELRSDNQLLGMEGYETYRVWADYITTQTNIDLIDFGKKDSDKTKTYGYKFAGDEIVFYDFIWEDDGIMGKAGKEVFRWKKQ